MKKNVLNSDVAQPNQTQLPDLGPEVASPSPAGDTETRNPGSLTDAELCGYIESAYTSHKASLKDNAPYFAQARKRFAQQGCRVPAPGRPTYEKWLEGLGLNPRSIRRVVAEYEAALGTTEQTGRGAKSDNSKRNAATRKKTPGSDKGSGGKRNMTRGTTYPTTKALQQLMKSWSKVFSGLGESDRSTQLFSFAESLSAEDRADLLDALHITMNPEPELPVASNSRIPDVSGAMAVKHLQRDEFKGTTNIATDGLQKTWSANTTTVTASATLPPDPKANPVPKDSGLRSLVREVGKEELDRMPGWNQ